MADPAGGVDHGRGPDKEQVNGRGPMSVIEQTERKLQEGIRQNHVVLRMNISEMPTACGPCDLSCTAICKEWTKVDRKEIGRTKSPNCPIIAILPEGHGDLVDWKDVKNELDRTFRDIVDDVSCAGPYMLKRSEYPQSLIEQPIRVKIIVPADTAERSDT